MITHCPSCELSFRVSAAQLAAAAGLVRCGACLKVFNAREYLDSESGEQQQATPAASNPAKPPHISPPLSLGDGDDFFIDDNFDLALLDQLSNTESIRRDDPAIKDVHDAQESQQGREAPPMDGQVGNVSFQDAPTQATATTTANTPATTPATAPDITQQAVSTPDPAPAVAAVTQAEPETQWAETEEPSPPPPPVSAVAEQPPPAPTKPAPARPITTHPAENASNTASIDAQGLSVADIPHHLATPAFDADHFARQDSERVASRSGWLWYPLLLIGIAALPLQYAHFHTDILGQNPRWRPALEALCQVTRCTLAPLANLDRITTTNLVVRSHPDQAGALRVDATLINRASFVQPFPHLILSFENLQGDVVASRNFAPGEYLGGELKGTVLMPIQQPIKLELDILDPGPEAVSYSLSVTDSSRQ